MTALLYFEVEQMPTTLVTANPDDDFPTEVSDPDALGLPSPARKALDRLIADQTSCEQVDCTNGIGWVLHERDDGGPSGLVWNYLAIILCDDGVYRLTCETCGPADRYAPHQWDDFDPTAPQ